ncbi:UDP-3-O-(3-hydroxymyristoyl)glucosamine N-acyltransferase [Candidatus Omnitrophota bacterium]
MAPARHSIQEIARLVGGEVVGDGDVAINGANGIEEAGEGEISFLADKNAVSLLNKTKASCVIVPPDIERPTIPAIISENPPLAFIKVVSELFLPPVPKPDGIHKTAAIAKSAKLGRGVVVGANAVIEAGAVIGENAAIYPLCYIGHDVSIGRDSVIYPLVTVREKVVIGKRVVIHSGAVIGADGFGYMLNKGVHVKIPQIGTVVIEDDVEIGVNTAVDRARLSKTVIGKGTKIDNLVQVAHNVKTGKHCILAGQTGLSGSSRLGDYVILGGQVGVADHAVIGDNVKVGGQAGVTKKKVSSGEVLWGTPARPLEDIKKIHAYTFMLPKLFGRVKALEKKIKELESK